MHPSGCTPALAEPGYGAVRCITPAAYAIVPTPVGSKRPGCEPPAAKRGHAKQEGADAQRGSYPAGWTPRKLRHSFVSLLQTPSFWWSRSLSSSGTVEPRHVEPGADGRRPGRPRAGDALPGHHRPDRARPDLPACGRVRPRVTREPDARTGTSKRSSTDPPFIDLGWVRPRRASVPI
jgi:hypothetical protein